MLSTGRPKLVRSHRQDQLDLKLGVSPYRDDDARDGRPARAWRVYADGARGCRQGAVNSVAGRGQDRLGWTTGGRRQPPAALATAEWGPAPRSPRASVGQSNVVREGWVGQFLA